MFEDKNISIIGFGNQAKAWALNLRDSGWKVSIGLRENSQSYSLCESMSFKTFNYETDSSNDLVAVLTPDDTHYEIVKSIHKLNPNSTFIYAHGFSLFYTDIKELFPTNHVLLAPKAIASELRYEYETKGKNGGVYSFEYAKDKNIELPIKNLASDLGLTSLHPASIEDETIADLFSEQTLLCSTLPYAALHSFNTLIEKGIGAEVAFFECWHEVKLIANTMVKLGPKKFFELISPNALIGSEIGRSSFFNTEYSKKLHEILNHISTGNFKTDLDNVQIEKVREDIISFWESQKLTQVHSELKQDLY